MEGYVATPVDVTEVVCPETRVTEDTDELEEAPLLETADEAELDEDDELSEDEEPEEVAVSARRPMLATTTMPAVTIMRTRIAKRTTLPKAGLPPEVRTNDLGCDNEIAPSQMPAGGGDPGSSGTGNAVCPSTVQVRGFLLRASAAAMTTTISASAPATIARLE